MGLPTPGLEPRRCGRLAGGNWCSCSGAALVPGPECGKDKESDPEDAGRSLGSVAAEHLQGEPMEP